MDKEAVDPILDGDGDEGFYSKKLTQLLAASFPHFIIPKPEIEEMAENDGMIRYRAKFRLLGQMMSTMGTFRNEVEAIEETSRVAYEVLEEFNRLILKKPSDNTSDEISDQLQFLFDPLRAEATAVAATPTQLAINSVKTINERLVQFENDKINSTVKAKTEQINEKMRVSTAEQPITVVKRENEAGSSSVPVISNKSTINLQPTPLTPLVIPVQNKSSYEPSPAATPVSEMPTAAPVFNSAPPATSTSSHNTSQLQSPTASTEKRKVCVGAPIPAFYEYVEKQPTSQDPIIFEDFQKGYMYGCRLRWGSKFWVAAPEYRQKKEAHNIAAIMGCIECFGECFIFEGIDPKIYSSWTRKSVRESSDKYHFRTSEELLSKSSCEDKTTRMVRDDNAILSDLRIEPLLDGRKYTSVINEICQKLKMTAPNYTVASVNALTNYYVCTVRNFHDLPVIETAPFTKKNDAKEDAAGRIYYLLDARGIVKKAAESGYYNNNNNNNGVGYSSNKNGSNSTGRPHKMARYFDSNSNQDMKRTLETSDTLRPAPVPYPVNTQTTNHNGYNAGINNSNGSYNSNNNHQAPTSRPMPLHQPLQPFPYINPNPLTSAQPRPPTMILPQFPPNNLQFPPQMINPMMMMPMMMAMMQQQQSIHSSSMQSNIMEDITRQWQSFLQWQQSQQQQQQQLQQDENRPRDPRLPPK